MSVYTHSAYRDRVIATLSLWDSLKKPMPSPPPPEPSAAIPGALTQENIIISFSLP